MIIVSRDKGTIINVKNIEAIGIGNPLKDEDGKFKILANTISDNQYTIAKYKTEERAKEVLQEIIKCYEMTEAYKAADTEGRYDIVANNTIFIYEMPEE